MAAGLGRIPHRRVRRDAEGSDRPPELKLSGDRTPCSTALPESKSDARRSTGSVRGCDRSRGPDSPNLPHPEVRNVARRSLRIIAQTSSLCGALGGLLMTRDTN